jgi:hypothetical protein
MGIDNREQKIQFLKNLAAGKNNMWAMLPAKFLEFEVYESKPGVEMLEGLEISVEEADEIRHKAQLERERTGRVIFIEVRNYL